MASLLSLIRLHQVRWGTVRDAVFLLGLAVTFIIQGADVIAQPGSSGGVDTIASLVIVGFLTGIARAWELIGGPTIGISQEVIAIVRGHEHGTDNPADGEPVL